MKQNEKSSKFVWFLLVIVVPAIFAVTVFAIVLSFMGVNVLEEAKNTGKKIPLIKNAFDEDELVTTIVNNENLEKQYQAKIDEQEDYIKLLTADLQKKEKEVITLKGDIALLEKQVEDAETTVKEEENEQLKKLYEAMSAKDAAAVMTEMSNNEVLGILTLLQSETQAAILAKLDRKRAAELTVLMASNSL
ncbi:MotE family protein [Fictibacillus nanhaiensis]|uniref:MotE family protein n=1 Tax=Fictibacillus nanhaiensis TaxID=742169 RepID=UPI001C977B31|nr:MotE family protein [Fictibacillus nanhaiensis]MBY6036091.1 MotE family protein [Fictibacillus nanhaiensis]